MIQEKPYNDETMIILFYLEFIKRKEDCNPISYVKCILNNFFPHIFFSYQDKSSVIIHMIILSAVGGGAMV